MTHVFRIEDSNPYAKSVVEFLKTLDFVKEEKIEKNVKVIKLTSEQKKSIDVGLNQIENGQTITHNQAMAEIKNRHPKYFK